MNTFVTMLHSKASTVLMVRPVRFGYDTETSGTNTFQQQAVSIPEDIQSQALKEFDQLAAMLRQQGINIIIAEDTHEPHTPDSIFPNNWISFHDTGLAVLYPMLAQNRRLERRTDIIDIIKKNFQLDMLHDMSTSEQLQQYLEGTGSIVFDYVNRLAFASISQRTHRSLVYALCEKLEYKPVIFTAVDRNGLPVYHTNVVMCIGGQFAAVCLECIIKGKQEVSDALKQTGKTIVPLSLLQVEKFAGNMYELRNDKDERLLLMSSQAYRSLQEDQVRSLEKFCRTIHSPLDTIELHGGGSARCMIADVRLPRRTN
jgi:hypothetical protein